MKVFIRKLLKYYEEKLVDVSFLTDENQNLKEMRIFHMNIETFFRNFWKVLKTSA